MLQLYGFMFLGTSTLNAGLSGSFTFACTIALIFYFFLYLTLQNYLFNLADPYTIAVWFTLFSLLGAAIGKALNRFALKGFTPLGNHETKVNWIVWGFVIIEHLTFFIYTKFELPWNIIGWFATFSLVWIVFYWVFRYPVQRWEKHNNERKMEQLNAKEPQTGHDAKPTVFGVVADLFVFFLFFWGIFVVYMIGQFAFYIPPIATDIGANLTSAGLGVIYVAIAIVLIRRNDKEISLV